MMRLLLSLFILLPTLAAAQSSVQLRYLMEGPASLMNATAEVSAARQRTLSQHYDAAPQNALDRVTVSLYNTAQELVASTDAWALASGEIVSAENGAALSFDAPAGEYHIVVSQAQHLPIVSKPVRLSGQRIDLTQAASLEKGSFSLVNGSAVAIAGNLSNPEWEEGTFVNAMDYFWATAYKAQNKLTASGYAIVDFNMDGQVDDTDLRLVERNANNLLGTTFKPAQ